MKQSTLIAAMSLTLGAMPALPVGAQDVLPKPEQPFAGKIGRTVQESTPDFPKETQAPKGAPNILLILTDDVGFAAASTFGGPIPTATMDRLAKNGLRYNTFHTTALCSPTRAALLVDGKQAGQSRIENTLPFLISADETLDCGEDTGTPVTEDYQVPFKFTGGLKKAVIDLSPENLNAEDAAKVKAGKAAIGISE